MSKFRALIVSDYDGTLIDDNKLTTLDETIEMIKDLRRIKVAFMISTGRTYDSIKKEVDKYQIPFDFISCANGNVLFDNNNTPIIVNHIDHPLISFLKSYCAEEIIQETLRDEFGYEVHSIAKAVEDFIHIRDNLPTRQKVTNLLMRNKLVDYCTDGKNKFSIHVFNNTDKCSTIDECSRRILLPSTEIYTIGNGPNDARMIKRYNGYIVGDELNASLSVDNEQHPNASIVLQKIKKRVG